jgi:hypothetical protein
MCANNHVGNLRNNFHILALKSLGFEFVTPNAFIASVLEEPKPFVMFLLSQYAHHTFILTKVIYRYLNSRQR